MKFDQTYYEKSCGKPYQRDEHWLSFFGRIAEKIKYEINPISVLDAGCAFGFLVEKLRDIGVEAYGLDISDYAISQTHENIKPYCWVASLTEPIANKYQLIVCIEVLEHMPKEHSEIAIRNLCDVSDDILFSSTPFDYKESTHVNVNNPDYWSEQFAKQGFFRDVNFDASFITPWAIRYRRRKEPLHRIIKEYEQIIWILKKENFDLRELVNEQQTDFKNKDREIYDIKNSETWRIVQKISNLTKIFRRKHK